MDPIS
jgi:hypothetical protein